MRESLDVSEVRVESSLSRAKEDVEEGYYEGYED